MVYWYIHVVLIKLAEKKHLRMAMSSGAGMCNRNSSKILIKKSDPFCMRENVLLYFTIKLMTFTAV